MASFSIFDLDKVSILAVFTAVPARKGHQKSFNERGAVDDSNLRALQGRNLARRFVVHEIESRQID